MWTCGGGYWTCVKGAVGCVDGRGVGVRSGRRVERECGTELVKMIHITFLHSTSCFSPPPPPFLPSLPSLLCSLLPSSPAQTNSRVPGVHAVSSHHLQHKALLRSRHTHLLPQGCMMAPVRQISNTPPLTDKLGTYTGLPLSSKIKKTSTA